MAVSLVTTRPGVCLLVSWLASRRTLLAWLNMRVVKRGVKCSALDVWSGPTESSCPRGGWGTAACTARVDVRVPLSCSGFGCIFISTLVHRYNLDRNLR